MFVPDPALGKLLIPIGIVRLNLNNQRRSGSRFGKYGWANPSFGWLIVVILHV